ncbi:hypothetical protein TSUD_322020 [Trifolium subterraneum]|uniref:Reverse transcriptase domain-containing protein n=1 Tax=Trifolium subterraneum TaxID=3900 RepID=A0A2Z6N4Z2_TRISU|nr:hypothetical protein TSUD_322020 [Trifolium subterraneum]
MDPWLLTVIYASPRMKKKGVQADTRKCLQFNRWINECNLMEVTTTGTKFTWRGPQWNGRDRVFKKLDRVLCNVSWRLRYHEGFAKVLPRVEFDHHPIIVIQENWTRGRDLMFLLSNITDNLKVWNKEVFGNIFKRKKELLARLNGIQNSPTYGYINFLESLEKELQDQLASTLYQEECLWNEAGHWIEDQENLSNMVRNFYLSLYHEDKPIRDPIISWTTYPQNLDKEQHKLSSPVLYSECKKALIFIWALIKGEDGYSTLFFQQNWDIVADSVYHYVNQVWSNPSLISSINNTFLVLIPKVDKPEFISQFRLIALWRTIHHNIIVAQEMVHSMARMKGREGPKISHLLFADNLLLFAEATIEQTHCIMHCLDLFCEASGQKINNQNTQIFFSKNVDEQLKSDIVQHTGYTPVNSFDKYLGANIASGRTTRGKFKTD